MANFELAVKGLLGEEGGFAREDNGRGNVKFGVTQKTLDGFWKQFKGACKKAQLPKKVRDFSVENAKDFYFVFWWTPYRLGEIENQQVAELVFQMSVNNPPKVAIGFAQLALGVEVDGVIGPNTLAAFNALDTKGRDLFAKLFRLRLQGRYERLAAEDPKTYGDDLDGWTNRLRRLAERCYAPQEGNQSGDDQH